MYCKTAHLYGTIPRNLSLQYYMSPRAIQLEKKSDALKNRKSPFEGQFFVPTLVLLSAATFFSCARLTPEMRYNRGVDYAAQGQFADAEEEYRLALLANPTFAQAQNNLGLVYLKLGRFSEAERAFQTAITIKPDYVKALENLAMTYEKMGGKDSLALEVWKKASLLEGRPDLIIRIERRISDLEAGVNEGSSVPFALSLFSPTQEQAVSSARFRVEGEVESRVGIERVVIDLNGQQTIADLRPVYRKTAEGTRSEEVFRFDKEVSLRVGQNKVMVAAYDGQGRSYTQIATVTRSPMEAAQFYSKRWGVVIGINRYEKWPSLEYAVNDAKSMAEELRRLGFDEVIEISNEDATQRRILRLLGAELPQRVGKEDLVFIFFAGHGQTEELASGRQKGYLIPVDGSLTDYLSTAISMEQVREFSERIQAKHIYYAIDACYSGIGLDRSLGISPETPGYLDKVTRFRSIQIATAGGRGEQVVERDGHGLFTQYLIQGLRGEADSDLDGVVTATELGSFIRPKVSNASGNRQTPQYGRIDGEGEIVFPYPWNP